VRAKPASAQPRAALGSAADPMLPVSYRVAARWQETHDSVSLRMEPVAAELPAFSPGQFTMLYKPGVGEVAISISGDPVARDGSLTQTIRDVGAVTRALRRTPAGGIVGVRGPFGTSWDLLTCAGHDLVIVAGGIGLAPLRPVVLGALARRADFRRVVLIAGARDPGEFLYRQQLADWAADARLEVHLTIDSPAEGWNGQVGFVTEPLARLSLEPARTSAFLCGPEPMLRFAAESLLDKGVSPASVQVSLERNMQCGVGLCGHCQLGPLLVCRDGPVVDYGRARDLLATREL
jgi:NAD(P)H-flavin reductase